MYIGIISDTHDNIIRIDQMLSFLNEKNINTIIHCGDVTNLETLKHLSKNFNGKIYLSLGNVDEMHGLEKKHINFDNVFVFEKIGELKINNFNIGFCHFPNLAKELAQKNIFDIVFYGHTHEPWEENINNTKLINPGTLAGMFNKSTFAILDTETKNIGLKIL
ncbi:MAG TPA: YfcE family phosphodiesterase [bacterium]|nr:YfcE family phosphodiesterase [bacterium]HOG38646.1 YfcE family phosphodiesterase [bacterium]HQI03505.1 YfcE family phosphodiesterase [bacterium]